MRYVAKDKELSTGKAGAVAERQVESHSLHDARAASKVMLQRVKNFVKSFYGVGELAAFGFGIPVPPTRPRLKQGPADPPKPA